MASRIWVTLLTGIVLSAMLFDASPSYVFNIGDTYFVIGGLNMSIIYILSFAIRTYYTRIYGQAKFWALFDLALLVLSATALIWSSIKPQMADYLRNPHYFDFHSTLPAIGLLLFAFSTLIFITCLGLSLKNR